MTGRAENWRRDNARSVIGSAAWRLDSLDPAFDRDPADEFAPCADNAAEDFALTQEQIDCSATS